MNLFTEKTKYSVPITIPIKGETPIFRNPASVKELSKSPHPSITSLKDIFLITESRYPNNPFLGTRSENGSGPYKWKSYTEIRGLAEIFGTNLIRKKLISCINEFRDYEMNFLGICSKNREEYVITDIASVLYGFTSVPIYDTLGQQSVEFILNQTKLSLLIVNGESLKKFIKEEKFGYIKNVICFDNATSEEYKYLQDHNIGYYSFQHLLNMENELPPLSYKVSNLNTIYFFSYTSGTTGDPKGAMMTHGNMLSMVSVPNQLLSDLDNRDIHLSYLPLAHMFERLVIWYLMYLGARMGFYGGDVARLKNDLECLKPTVLPVVPRLLNRFYEILMSNINKLTGFKKYIADRAIKTKLKNLKKSNVLTHCLYDYLVFNKMKQALGGHIKYMLVGSAPTSIEVLDFMKIAFSCPIIEGYGQTEGSGASFLLYPDDNQGSGTVGGVTISTEFKIVDVPEMNYYSTDLNEKGEMSPRGECWVRGPGIFLGYYKDEKKTSEAVDVNGWLHSGDVVQMNQNGSIKIIDRIKNIFKLAQGEYVAAEKIEMIYLLSNVCAEIFVYGDSLQYYLIAIVVPKMDFIKKWANENKIAGNYDELLKLKEVKNMVLQEMTNFGKTKNLLGFEIVKNIYLEKESFANRDLLTATFKMKRFEFKKFYNSIIEDLYKEGPSNIK